MAIDDIPENGFTPRSNDSYLSRGSIAAVCEDEAKRSWLVETASSFAIWEGLMLKADGVEQLLEYKIVVAFIPGLPASTELILKRLQKQNF